MYRAGRTNAARIEPENPLSVASSVMYVVIGGHHEKRRHIVRPCPAYHVLEGCRVFKSELILADTQPWTRLADSTRRGEICVWILVHVGIKRQCLQNDIFVGNCRQRVGRCCLVTLLVVLRYPSCDGGTERRRQGGREKEQ